MTDGPKARIAPVEKAGESSVQQRITEAMNHNHDSSAVLCLVSRAVGKLEEEITALRAELANRPSEWLVKATIEERDSARAELAQAKEERREYALAAGDAYTKILFERDAAKDEIAKLRAMLDDIERLKVKRFSERHYPPCNNYDCDRCYR